MSSLPSRPAIGMKGRLRGNSCLVVGSARLGARVGFFVEYWYEYYLVDANGGRAVLALEFQNERARWKWFEMIDPAKPIPLVELEYKTPGDRLQVDRDSYGVTFVGKSQVYSAEGECPEGVRVGSRANIVNALDGAEECVVSWTGEQVEYYRGKAFSAGYVETAFELALPSTDPQAGYMGKLREYMNSPSWVVTGTFVILLTVVLFAFIESRLEAPPKGTRRQPTHARAFVVNETGNFEQRRYVVRGVLIEERRTHNGIFESYEVDLVDEQHHSVRLVNALDGVDDHWFWLSEEIAGLPLMPVQAAGLKEHSYAHLGSSNVWIDSAYQDWVERASGSLSLSVKQDGPSYGFVGKELERWWMVRWNASTLTAYRGFMLKARALETAFPQGH